MRDEPILEIGVEASGRLFVRPAQTTFEQIYRAALGVNWDDARGALISSVPREWTFTQWFQQVLAAAFDEYGVVLKLTHLTKWSDVPAELQREMESFATSDWPAQLISLQKEHDARYWSNHQLEQALSEAAQLWVEGNYVEYVRILAPYRNQLSQSQRKRLTLAERRQSA